MSRRDHHPPGRSGLHASFDEASAAILDILDDGEWHKVSEEILEPLRPWVSVGMFSRVKTHHHIEHRRIGGGRGSYYEWRNPCKVRRSDQVQERIEEEWWAKQLGHARRSAAAAAVEEAVQPNVVTAVEAPLPPRESEDSAPARRELPPPLPLSLTEPEATVPESPEINGRPDLESPPDLVERQPTTHASPSRDMPAAELTGDLIGLLREHRAELIGYLLVVLLGLLVGWIASALTDAGLF